MIVHITKDTVERAWPYIESALARALEKTSLRLTWGLEDAKAGLESGDLEGFFQPLSGYCGVFSFNETPKAKILYFFWSGKREDNSAEIDYEEVDKYLELVAKENGCTLIECEGRKGWKHVLLPLGYQEDSHFYSKEVSA